ncbi:hypothetical protein [Pseudoneobacillus sp. C159]
MFRFVRVLIVFVVLLGIFVNFGLPAQAEDVKINLTLDEGFDGKVKRGKGFPLTIKLDNNGEAFSGDLLIQYSPSYNTGGYVVVPVDLPQGSSKTYQVAIQGLNEDMGQMYQNQPTVFLYKGGWGKGQQVTFQGDKNIRARFIDPMETVIGVLSENYDRLKELRTLPRSQTQMLPLNKEQLPKQGMGLEMIDYLVIDEYAISDLDEQQQEAIKEWIQSGGVLIAGAAPDASSSYGLLYSLLPMKSEVESSGSAAFFQRPKEEKPPFNEIKLFTGPVETGAEILQKSGSLPATVKKQFGNGMILQTSFSLGDQPLASWKEYNSWFVDLLKYGNQSSQMSNRYGQDLLDQLYWEFAETNEFFPSSNYSIPQLIVIILVYLIVIVPILYFVLRKWDKREHAWWIIPALSVTMSAIVFGIGARDRISEPQLNQMGVYKLNGNQLVGLQASTLLTNRSGDYTLRVPRGEYQAVPHGNNRGGGALDPLMGAIVIENRKETEMVFPKVGYWSSKTIYGKSQTQSDGQFIAHLEVKDGQLVGTIENRFPYDFKEIFIWSGNKKISLGSIKKGETIKVDQKSGQTLLTGPTMLSNANMYPNQNTDLEKMKMERLQYTASNFLLTGYQGTVRQPMIAGFTKESIVKVDMVGKKERQNNLNLVLAPFTAKTDFSGSFSLTNEMLNPRMEVISGIIHEDRFNGSANEVLMENGEYDYILQLPEPLKGKKIKFENMKIRLNGPSNAQFSVLNRVTGKYLELDSAKMNLTIDQQVEHYFSKDGELLIKVHKNANNGDPYVYLPSITVKGEVTP